MREAESGVMGPVQGILLDRFGPRAVARAGVVLLGVGFMLFSFVQTPVQFFGAFLVMSIGASLTGYLTIAFTAVHWFERRRATAISRAMREDLDRVRAAGRRMVETRFTWTRSGGTKPLPPLDGDLFSQAFAVNGRRYPAGSNEVLGVADREWGQRVVAVVVSQAGVAVRNVPPLDDLRNWVSQTLPRTWAPRQLFRVDEMPLLPNGKVDRVALQRAVDAVV